jgi:radical SAM protein with 4Fe4S-binding SPASM domain
MSQTSVVPAPTRALRKEDDGRAFPLYVVWEITMKCDQPCGHCGSRSGRARPNELSTDEAFEVCDALVRLGSREVTLIGGEAYLREDCEALIRRLATQGIRVTMQTGGRAFTIERARRFRDAGLEGLGVSIDGPASAHDRLRGNLGSHAAAVRALKNAAEVGLVLSANTQINKLNLDRLPETADLLRGMGVQVWQVQLTGPLGRAADHPEWIVDPWQIVPIIDTLADIQKRAVKAWEDAGKKGIPFNVQANNNVGYFGPHEIALRSRPYGRETHFRGCVAGIYSMGIESDGTIKACPTLPTAPYGAGNVRDTTIQDLWESSKIMRFSRDRGTEELWGFCKTCYYGSVCQAGCSWTAHTLLGKRGNMPICYHRVTQLKRKGIRERLVKVEQAPGVPFDFGRFEIVEEPWPEGELASAAPADGAAQPPAPPLPDGPTP